MVWKNNVNRKNYVTLNQYVTCGNYVSRKILTSLAFGMFVGSLFALMFNVSTTRKPITLLNARRNSDLQAFTNKSLAYQVYKEVKILCFIMTQPKNHKTKAIHVMRTWGHRCNKLLFVSSETDDEIGAIKLPVKEGRMSLWHKIRESFKYIYKNHLYEYDWFLKADDDTYVIIENLRFMLYPHATDTPLYFGCRFKKFSDEGYMSGGAGYVLSREAVRRFVEIAVWNTTICNHDDTDNEDVVIASCLRNVDVHPGDSRDEAGKGRFYPLPPEHHLLFNRSVPPWYWDYIYYKTDEGPDTISDYGISFHYISATQMYVLDYLIYQLQPYGIIKNSQLLPKKLGSDALSSIET